MMSLAKKISIAAMIVIFVVIGVIIVVSNKNAYDVNKKLDQASGYFEMMDYDKTIATYNSIISNDKTCVEAYIGLASAYSAKGNETKALEILEQGLDATRNHTSIAKKIEEMSGVAVTDTDNAVTDTIAAETEVVTTAPVIETTVPETTVTTEETTVTTEETTVTTEETTVTTEETTVTTEETTVTTEKTTVATTEETTVATTARPTISVPNFIGISKDEAAKLAKNKNIKLAFEYENNDTYPNGFVYYQSNREGTLVASSTTVYAYVCVNDIEYVSEETKALRSLGKEVKNWVTNNGAGKVSIDEKNNSVTINANSTKRFVLDEAVVKAMRKCDNATLRIVTKDFTMTISTASVKNVSSLNLSSDYSGNYSRASFTIESGADDCDVKVVLTGCEIISSDYENMKLHINNKKPTTFELSIDEEPIIMVSESGTYTIK